MSDQPVHQSPDQRTRKRWAPRLAIIALMAVGAAWGLNQAAIWQLERHAPEPADVVVSAAPAPTASAEPAVSPDLIVEESVIEQLEVPADDTPDPDNNTPDLERSAQPSLREAPAPSKAASSRPAPKKRAPSKSSDSKDAPSQPEKRVFAVDIDRLRQQFKRPEDAAGHGQILPNYKGGERRGLKFAGVAPGGLFGRLGIESGDVILSVNGTKITTQQKALADFEKMRKLRTFHVVLERHGQPRHHRYVLK